MGLPALVLRACAGLRRAAQRCKHVCTSACLLLQRAGGLRAPLPAAAAQQSRVKSGLEKGGRHAAPAVCIWVWPSAGHSSNLTTGPCCGMCVLLCARARASLWWCVFAANKLVTPGLELGGGDWLAVRGRPAAARLWASRGELFERVRPLARAAACFGVVVCPWAVPPPPPAPGVDGGPAAACGTSQCAHASHVFM